uniref:Uncharacterized protein n=1 Tax=Candidatus Kentrum sp. DK TaxID=2126562 RepID=A0A450RXZ4_9GAMM|nr:MAG: hypothetical protein BECKDK2373C_GA0170839_100721 [Candidatus Kentron sp. DK]
METMTQPRWGWPRGVRLPRVAGFARNPGLSYAAPSGQKRSKSNRYRFLDLVAATGHARSLSDLGVRREGKRDRDQNLCKFEANSGLFNEDLRKFWPISAFPQQNHPKSDRLLGLSFQ